MGCADGRKEGRWEGTPLGAVDGATDRNEDGMIDGDSDGLEVVGAAVGGTHSSLNCSHDTTPFCIREIPLHRTVFPTALLQALLSSPFVFALEPSKTAGAKKVARFPAKTLSFNSVRANGPENKAPP